MSDGRRTPHVVHVLEAIEGGTARHVVDIARHAARHATTSWCRGSAAAA